MKFLFIAFLLFGRTSFADEIIFNTQELLRLDRLTSRTDHLTDQYGSKLSSETQYMLKNFVRASKKFTRTCAHDWPKKPTGCIYLLDDTWTYYYPVNPHTGRLKGHWEFSLLLRNLMEIDTILKKITYGRF